MRCRYMALVFVFLLFLTSCVDANVTHDFSNDITLDFSDNSQGGFNEFSKHDENSTEKREEWQEVEELGNTKITRQYYNFGTECTVTTDTFRDDGTLYQTTIVEYKEEVIIGKQTKTMDYNGFYEKTEEKFSLQGNATELCIETFRGKYIQKMQYVISDNSTAFSDSSAHVEYYTVSGQMVAKGDTKTDTINGVLCLVESLDIYKNDVFSHKQIKMISSDNSELSVYQIFNTDDELVFSKENSTKKEVVSYHGKDAFKVETSSGISVYTDTNSNLIAVVNGSVVEKIGDKYRNIDIVTYINEKVSVIRQCVDSFIALD